MKYVFPIALLFSLSMALTADTTQRFWWAVLVLGILANALVVGANQWKMPVWGGSQFGPRHQAMTSQTRLKWLADVIPTGLGRASLGDFCIVGGILGVLANRSQTTLVQGLAAGWLLFWISGWSGGVRLSEKWSREERKDARKNIPIVLLLLLVGNLLGVHGCGKSEIRASLERITPAGSVDLRAPETRLLTKVEMKAPAAPLFEVLKRIKLQEAAKAQQEIEQKQQEARDLEKRVKAQRQWNDRREEAARQKQRSGWNWVITSSGGSSATPVTNGGGGTTTWVSMSNQIQKVGTRKGPFCRITCLVHHENTYDVETDAEYCKADQIARDAVWVPGWDTDASGQYEYRVNWPGPAQAGFHSYKLYWK